MFQDSFVNGNHSGRRPLSFTASLLMQCGLVALLLVVPLMNTAELPAASWVSQILAPAPPPAAVPPPVAPVAAARPVPVRQYTGALLEPREIPEKVTLIEDVGGEEWAPPQIGVPHGVPCPGCPVDNVISAIASSERAVPLPPPSVVRRPEPVVPDAPVRVVSVVQAAKLITKVTPVYPEIPKRAGISGVVEIEAIIARDGTMRSLRVLRGHPLLVNAAMDAVKQWRYQPTMLQGQPVEVITHIQVNFTLR